MSEKISWQGTVLSVQPRIKLLRSFDQRNHSYLGYALLVQGRIGESDGEFLVAIGKAAQEKHKFQAGDVVSGVSQPVADSETEVRRVLQDERPEADPAILGGTDTGTAVEGSSP